MDEQMLLIVSVAVFTLMLLGLILTVREFKKYIDVDETEDDHAHPRDWHPNTTSMRNERGNHHG